MPPSMRGSPMAPPSTPGRKSASSRTRAPWSPDKAQMAVASLCKVSGSGIETAVVRQQATFTIQTVNHEGNDCTEGGEIFVVVIRGSGFTMRAKVVDNDDGTYLITYKAENAAKHRIDIMYKENQHPIGVDLATAEG